MANPSISIIVPVYMVEQYLAECVDSILSQSFVDFELILVDDGSPDNCPVMCDDYARQDKRIKVIHKKNGGLSDTRNHGLKLAKGNYVTFVDSDDLLPQRTLESLYNEITSSNANIVLGKVERFIVNGPTRPYTNLEERKEFKGKEALCLILEGRKLNISMCGALYKRSLWNDIEMPVGYIFEDWYTTPILYLKANNVVFTPIPSYLYRDNPESIMSSMHKKCNPQVIEVAEHTIDVIRNHDHQLYLDTLWSNARRVWKYVGIVYSQGRIQEETQFLGQVRAFLKKYRSDLRRAAIMSFSVRVGVWSFCYCEPLFLLLYKLKNQSN